MSLVILNEMNYNDGFAFKIIASSISVIILVETWNWLFNLWKRIQHIVNGGFELGKTFPKNKILFISGIALSLIIGMIQFKETGTEDGDNLFGLFSSLFGLLGMYLSVSWLFDLWSRYMQSKNERTKAELKLLKSQVNPHFFFNTLNNLYGLTVEKSDKAPEVVLKISDMMRYTIYEGQKETVPIEEELEYLQGYIELHRIRYHKNVSINFQHQIHETGYKVTPLLFIILLENAIKHGVETLTENAFINIQLIAGSNKILFAIENNFDSEQISEERGIGLQNLKRRLELLYPGKHRLLLTNENNVFKAFLNIYIA